MTSVPCASGRKGIVLYENGEMQLFEKSALPVNTTEPGIRLTVYLWGHI